MYITNFYILTKFSYGIWSSFFVKRKLSLPYNVSKFNLKINYPPLYEREVWHYQKANADQIRQVISEFPWDNHFANINIDEQMQLFSQTIQNIISNYIPHEAIPREKKKFFIKFVSVMRILSYCSILKTFLNSRNIPCIPPQWQIYHRL